MDANAFAVSEWRDSTFICACIQSYSDYISGKVCSFRTASRSSTAQPRIPASMTYSFPIRLRASVVISVGMRACTSWILPRAWAMVIKPIVITAIYFYQQYTDAGTVVEGSLRRVVYGVLFARVGIPYLDVRLYRWTLAYWLHMALGLRLRNYRVQI